MPRHSTSALSAEQRRGYNTLDASQKREFWQRWDRSSATGRSTIKPGVFKGREGITASEGKGSGE